MNLIRVSLRRKALLSKESGVITKKSSDLRVALGFPNTYDVAISNLGFQTVYRLFNRIDQVRCERFFLFDFPSHRGTRTLESNRDIKEFDIIAFSVPFELDYPNILKLLKLSHIPLLSSDRKSVLPLMIAGGIAPTLNPEVLASFMDCLLIGEAEEMLIEFVERYLQYRSEKMTKENLLLELSKIEGVYVPRFYGMCYYQDGTLKKLEIDKDVPRVIRRRNVDLKNLETFSPITSPYAHFKNSLLIEVGRGCSRGCRFCAAGYAYQPCRFYKKEIILSEVTKYAGKKRHVGLIGSLISDHPELEDICLALNSRHMEIGTSSLRVDMISPELLKILVDSGMRTLTVAPEVGTDRMWKVIKKNIDRESVLRSVKIAYESGISNLKLYFIIGLPFEKEADIDGIIELIHQVHAVFLKSLKLDGTDRKNIKRLKVSINPFIPKPHTPFQWCGMDKESELKRKLLKIGDGIKNLKGVRLERKSIRQAIIQGLFSMGNRSIGEGLYHYIEEGMILRQAWKKVGVNPDLMVFSPKNIDSKLPWDIIDSGINKQLLIKELNKAKKAAEEGSR